MHNTRQTSSVEQRRKLLKAALAASSVAGMGYSGAALASISCVAKVRDTGAYPAGASQFRTTAPADGAQQKWAWKEVAIHQYKVSADPTSATFDGFVVNDVIYKAVSPPVTASGFQQPDAGVYPKKGWVLAYFDDNGVAQVTYPTQSTAVPGQTPATGSCLNSINPGIAGFTFGG